MSDAIEATEALSILKSEDGRRLPQKVIDCAATILADCYHGKEWPVEWFEQNLAEQRETIGFGKAVSQIGFLLEIEGFHLTSRGRNGAFYRIDDLERTLSISKAFNRQAVNLFRRAAVFGSNALRRHGHLMDENQRKRVEKATENAALRYVLSTRIK